MADRICRFVDAVGDRERVIAGCWATADVAWKKMNAGGPGKRNTRESGRVADGRESARTID